MTEPLDPSLDPVRVRSVPFGIAPYVILGVVGCLLAACGTFEPKPLGESPSEERLDRPGVFSGESGTFIWRGSRRPEEAPDQADIPDEGGSDH